MEEGSIYGETPRSTTAGSAIHTVCQVPLKLCGGALRRVERGQGVGVGEQKLEQGEQAESRGVPKGFKRDLH